MNVIKKDIKSSVYKKHNSFNEFKSEISNKNLLLQKIQNLLENELLNNNVNANIYKQIHSDLFLNENSDSGFKISNFLLKEIETLDENEILRYLFHRYRYEIFPIKNRIDDYPPYLQIEPTSFCNYRCIFCYQTDKNLTTKANGHLGKMSLELFKEIIDQSYKNIEFISLASRGEPLMCPKIEEMLEYTSGKFLNLKINTNASLLNESKCHAILSGGVKTLVFSADAADHIMYSQFRVNGKLDTVLKNIELFNKIKDNQYKNSKIITRVSGVKVSENQDFDEMEKFWGSMVDQVAFVNYIAWENVYDSPLSNIAKPCSDLWRRMFIWWDGKTNTCDVDYLSHLSPGNFNDFSIKDIWNGENYTNLRQKHFEDRSKINPCNKCTLI